MMGEYGGRMNEGERERRIIGGRSTGEGQMKGKRKEVK